MKKYIVIAVLLLSTGVFAQQQDSLLRRQMELERDFNPTLQDANKITSLPELAQPIIKKANTNYSTWAGRTTPPLEIALPRPGTIMTEIPFSTKKGYLMLNGGNYANINGALGYRFLETDKNSLNFSFLHNSTNGSIQYLQEGTEPNKNNAYLMDNFGQLKYNHLFDAFKLNLHASYLHSMFNYYGNTFGNLRVYDNEKQRVGVANFNLGVESNESDILTYRGYLDFKNFSSKFGEQLTSEGVKGNQIDAMVGLAKPFQGGDSKIGIDGKLFGAFYDRNTRNNLHAKNYLLTNAAPYVSFEGVNWMAKLGVDVLFQLAGKTRVRVAPNVNLEWSITENSSLYADIKGGFANNTYLDMLNESRYISPGAAVSVKPSFSIVDIEAGAKIGEVNGFRFDIFGGFKKTDDEHFLIISQSMLEQLGLGYSWRYKNYLMPIYGNLSHSHVGAMIQTNSWSPLDIAVRVKKNFYTIKDIMVLYNNMNISEPKPYNKPGVEADIRATFEAMSNLKFMLNYYFAGDRWSYFDGANVKMSNINDLSLGAVYDISPSFSINLKAHNLLFQQYDIWYGHPAQDFNVMGGFTFKF